MDQFRRGELTFPVLDAGPQDAGPESTVVLLHGFPQTSAAWSGVAPRLNAAGLRTLAPDIRGTAPLARPAAREAYRMKHLVGDVIALLDAAGLDSAHLVGHDWGGGIAWATALRHPERIRSLTALSTPHPATMTWAGRHSTQALKSWYMFAMQVPFVPERLLATGVRRRGLGGLGLPEEHQLLYRRRFGEVAAMAGALGPYRGMLAGSRRRRPNASAASSHGSEQARPGEAAALVTVPTTYMWGNRDPYLGRAAAERTGLYCEDDYRFVELDADHWLPEKHPARVADEIRGRVSGA